MLADTKITIKERMSFLRDILINPSITLRCFDAKEVYKMFHLRYEIRCGFQDPNAGDWILNSESCYKSYNELVIKIKKKCAKALKKVTSLFLA
jgi:hypothetical protein